MVQPKKQWGLLISQEQLDASLYAAAKGGAEEALRRIGLGDENAGADVKEFRELLSNWRLAKKTVFVTVVKWVTVAVIGAIMTSMAILHYGGGK